MKANTYVLITGKVLLDNKIKKKISIVTVGELNTRAE